VNKIAKAGNSGKGVRSDCSVTLEITKSNGIEIALQSKVKVLYGESIVKLCNNILKFYNIKNAKVTIEDAGALDFVIAARIETAIRQCISTNKEYLPALISENKEHTTKERNRISRLYLPGNSPNFMLNAGVHKPNAIILDLEDSVAPSKKEEAQLLVRNALRQVNFYGAERMVRINQIPNGLNDLDYIIPHNVNLILVPKCESSEQIQKVNARIKDISKKYNIKNPVWLMPIIESALGVVNSYKIATAADNIAALAIGLEDYTADIGVRRTKEATESFFARSMVVNAARAAGIQPIDSVFSDIEDLEALKQNVLVSKGLGFEGMGCIHPRQIKVIHENYAPGIDEIEKAKKIVAAFNEAQEEGLGVVALGSKMIDAPVVKRALRTIDIAINFEIISNNWRKE
jgi:citrate lyase subunit beta/citryl-CoA lyase